MDVEKLLGKLLHEITDSGGKQFNKKYKKYKKKHKHKEGYYHQGRTAHHSSKKTSLLDNLTGNLKSGKGLLTAIGLGVGAYEIYRTSRQTQQPQSTGGAQQYPPQTPLGQQAGGAPPPPPPPAGVPQEQSYSSPPSGTAPPAISTAEVVEMEPVHTVLDEQEVARRLIRVMVGAAHADGTLDQEEEKAILDHLRHVELAQEEKMFLLEELHHPRTIDELTQGIEDARLGQAMYALAASAVLIDTESERQWFDALGKALGLSPEVSRFIEENQ
ncbi:MAG: DUF533 domain-containing protein [Candidatus Electrothrix aestuarii]|uniref:DUF533 domain-containing protein n=1 Tax=Candidatus Electrothrix aestuarii TaxID=3062594 RepID=A0AAU8LTN8_9BACT|nr:DUF533 domain-containing protein [Candidatus Electrothrix aestuarii]